MLSRSGVAETKDYPKASAAILSNFYVDDLLTSAHTADALKKQKQDIIKVLSNACFELRK
jgi:hypothetical protein